MLHVPPLVSTIAIGLVLAFAFGVLAHRFKLPPLVGYLVAGIVIGPFTPGFVADQNIANQLAEVGVILLMFGVGLHFSLKDLLRFAPSPCRGRWRKGLVATPLGMAVGWSLGWSAGAGLIFGVALSVASTVVLLRVLQERRLIETERGRITVGWLIVQDIAMVLVLVLLPGLDGAIPRHGDGARRGRDRALDHHPARQVRHFHRRHAAVRQEADPGDPALCRPYRQPRAVPPGRAVDRAWASPTPRRSCSASRWRWAPSSPA